MEAATFGRILFSGKRGRDGSAPTGHFGGGGYGHFGILISFQIMDINEHLLYQKDYLNSDTRPHTQTEYIQTHTKHKKLTKPLDSFFYRHTQTTHTYSYKNK